MIKDLYPFIQAYALIIGLAIGSFLNVIIYRLPHNKSIVRPRSKCTGCGTQIAWYDNIPVLSYILILGKCRNCKAAISIRYPLIELICGLITITLLSIYGLSLEFIVIALLCYMLIAITFIDVDHFIIPNGFVLIGLGALAVGIPTNWIPIEWEDAVSGAFVFAGFLFTIGLIGQFILRKESIGFGDVKLGLVLGGYLGVEYSVLALYLSFVLAAIMVFIMLGGKILKKNSKIPFGPYLAGGTLIAILTKTPYGGNYILNWYYSTMF